MKIPSILVLVGVVSASLILLPPPQVPFGYVSANATLPEVMLHVQYLPIEFDPAMKVNGLMLGDELACRDVLHRFLSQFDGSLTFGVFSTLPDVARIRRAMLEHHRRHLYSTWELQNRAGAVREPPYDRSVTRTLIESLPPQRDLRYLLESELTLIYRIGRLFSIIRTHAEISRQLNFWPLYLSRQVPNPEELIESTLAAIVTFSIFLEACSFPTFTAHLHASAALHAACETRAWSSISPITTSTSRFRIRDRFWSTLFPVQPGGVAVAIAALPFEFNPAGKDYCYGSNSNDCLKLLSEFSDTMGYGVNDKDDKMHAPAELLAFKRSLASIDYGQVRHNLLGINVSRLHAVAALGNLSMASSGWTETQSAALSAEAAGTADFAFFFDFVHNRKAGNLRYWKDFWQFYFTASETIHLQNKMESFIKAGVLRDNLRRALRLLCASDEAQAQITGNGPPSDRRMRIRRVCIELPNSITFVREQLGIPAADIELLRTEWWSLTQLVEILRPRFAYFSGGVRYQVNIVQVGSARFYFIAPQPQSRPITQFLRTRQPGVELEDCPVCQEPITEGGEFADLPCSHTCCRGCMQRWADVNPSCPLCRAPIFERNVRRRLG